LTALTARVTKSQIKGQERNVKVLGADIGFGYTKATDGRQFLVF
jgi:hypothetical protein